MIMADGTQRREETIQGPFACENIQDLSHYEAKTIEPSLVISRQRASENLKRLEDHFVRNIEGTQNRLIEMVR